MRYIVAGGRDFKNYHLINDVLPHFIEPGDEIVSGGANGADMCGEYWANTHQIPCKVFPAKWDTYGKAAGFIRNAEMGEYADVLIAFWDKRSKGTQHMIQTMKHNKKPYYVYDYHGNLIEEGNINHD